MLPEELIQLALSEASKAFAAGEVPIGAVISNESGVISKTYNQVETRKDACAHAEILAINEASSKLGRWRLEDCTLTVTLEPCPMCMSAIRLSRIKAVIYGGTDSRYGFSIHAPTLSDDKSFGLVPTITSGVLKVECTELIQQFFKLRR